MKLAPKFVMGHLGVAQASTGEAAGSIDQMVYANTESVAVIPTESVHGVRADAGDLQGRAASQRGRSTSTGISRKMKR